MKNKGIKEYDKSFFAVDIMLYGIICAIGVFMLKLPSVTKADLVKCLSTVFLVFGFFSLIAYFFNKKENENELLYFGFINMCVSVYILFNIYDPEMNYVVSNAMLFYTIAYGFNKLVSVYKLFIKKDLNFIPKAAVGIMVVVVSYTAFQILQGKIEVATMIYGYYFIGLGLLSLIEVLLIILFNGRTFRKKMIDLLNYDEVKPVENKKVEVRKMQQVKRKKITPKNVEKDEEEEIAEVVEEKKPKKKKKKKTKKVVKDNK